MCSFDLFTEFKAIEKPLYTFCKYSFMQNINIYIYKEKNNLW